MPRPPFVVTVLCAWLWLALGVLAPGAVPAHALDDDTDGSSTTSLTDPLMLQIINLSPQVLTPGDDVTITGTITNTTATEYTGINVLGFRSNYPITDAATLSQNAASEPSTYVGDRVTEAGSFKTIASLAPGDTATFAATLPASTLPRLPGVYWIGVHAIGDSADAPRDEYADGRARTFISIPPTQGAGARAKPLRTAMMVPLRQQVRFDGDGRVRNMPGWTELLTPGGRLHNLLQAGNHAGGDHQLTWLIDPAVLSAVSALAHGNQGLDLSSAPSAQPGADDKPTASGSPTPSASTSLLPEATASDSGKPSDSAAPQSTPEPELSGLQRAAKKAATNWLRLFAEVIAGQDVLTLPFGDLDVAAAAAHNPALLRRSITHAQQLMSQWEIPAQAAVAPSGGSLPAAAVGQLPTGVLIVLSDSALDPQRLAQAGFDHPPTFFSMAGHRVLLTSDGVAEGGPAPEPAGAPIAVRQRLLAEATLRILADNPQPMVVLPPNQWDPLAAADLVTGADTSVIRVRELSRVRPKSQPSLSADLLTYSQGQQKAQLPSSSFLTADGVIARGDLLATTLANRNTVADQVLEMVLCHLSEATRLRTRAAAQHTARLGDGLRRMLNQIEVSGPRLSVLASNSGDVGVTVTNGLDEPVRVTVTGLTDDTLTLERSGELLLAPKARRRLLLTATSSEPGIHTVTLQVSNADGQPIGSTDSFSLRASNYSRTIWYGFMGLFVLAGLTFVYRAARRVRQVQREGRWAQPQPTQPTQPEPTQPQPTQPEPTPYDQESQ